MKYIWTVDTGAGLHYWELVNHFLLYDEYIVESKQSNQGLLDAVRAIDLSAPDHYFLAFDIVYDNMDIMNKYLDLVELADRSAGKIRLLDTTCFEYTIVAFKELINWTESGRKDKISIRRNILEAMEGHQINLDKITDRKTLQYLMGFKRYSTERVMKSLAYELTDQKEWSVKGHRMGGCWYKDCCVMDWEENCRIKGMKGKEKISVFLQDEETTRIMSAFP